MDKFKKVVCIALSVVLLTGCGGRYLSSEEGGTVSGGAVSGGTVSGGAVSGGSVEENVISGPSVDGEESTESTGKGISGRFCTDTNLYFGSEYHDISWSDGAVQTRLDGTHEQKIKLKDFDFLIGVADGWLYYGCYIEEQGIDVEGICRVPIRKENGYDRVEPDREERLVEVEDPDCILSAESVCLVGDSLYYCFCPELKKNNVILERFDLKTGKKDSKRIIDGGKEVLLNDAGERVYAATDAGLYTQRLNESDWTLIDGGRLGDLLTGEDIQICTGKACYYGQFDGRGIPELRRIDAATGEDTLFTSEETLCGAVRNSEGMEGAEELSGWIDSVHYDEGRIWILAQINWMENGVYHMEYRVFSQGEKETGLRYEEELTGCMHDHNSVRTGKWKMLEEITVKENVELNEGVLYAVESGRAYMALYDGEKKKYRVGYYEIGNGKFHWLTNRDPIFYGPVVSGRYQNYNNWDVFSVYDSEPYRKDGIGFNKDDWEICDMMYEIDAGEDGFFEESN